MTRRTTHLADGPPRGSGRVSLINQLDDETGAALQLLGETPHLNRSLRILPIFVERQSDHEATRLEGGGAANELGNRWTLTRASENETRR